MKKYILVAIFLFFIISLSCKDNDNREGVSKSKTLILYSKLETSHLITSYLHTIYIGNYIVRDSVDKVFLLNNAIKYVDTVRSYIPVKGIIFINDTIDYPKYMDDEFRLSNEYKKKKDFSSFI